MKVKLGAKNCLYPLPTTLVGANVNGKPNFITMAHVGIADVGSISMGMHKSHYSNIGIRVNQTFSVNIPSIEMVKETDYCGLVSGKNVDKSMVFEVFYGKLETAPMIKACPINMECRLIHTVDLPNHDVFIGEVIETYCDEKCLKDEVVDFSKVQPILFVMNDRSYWKLGEQFAKAQLDSFYKNSPIPR
jgi:flavin reductase (DIM6/NTAB) family NADH-FMN oxidoreductase RutF